MKRIVLLLASALLMCINAVTGQKDYIFQREQMVKWQLQGRDITTAVNENSQPDQFFLDLVGLEEPEKLKGEYRGICW